MAVAACSQRPAFDPLAEGAVVLAFGDSITYGTGAGGALNYPAYLSHDTGWQVVNAGVPGDTAHGARDRIGPLLTQHRPEMVIVELGGNDFLRQRPPGQVKEDLRAILRDIAEADALVVLLAARIINKPPNIRFAYGYQKADTVAATILSFVIFFAGAQLAWSSVHVLLGESGTETPSRLAISITRSTLEAW